MKCVCYSVLCVIEEECVIVARVLDSACNMSRRWKQMFHGEVNDV